MKKRDLIYLLLAVAIMLVAGYLAVTQVVPKKSSDQGVVVEKIGKIEDRVDEDGLTALRDPQKATDFSSPVDLGGLSNPAPFGP